MGPSPTPRWPPWRWQPPVHSPLSAAALLGAVPATLGARRSRRALLGARLRQRYNADRVVLLSSGTAALQLALETHRTSNGALRVALPAFACFDLVTSAVPVASELRFYDVDPGTLGPDPDSVARVLERGVEVLVVAHLFGVPVDWSIVDALCARHDVPVIEDAAQGHGATWHDRPLGALGSQAILSFGRGKGWTGGRGGALLIRRGREPDVPRSASFRAESETLVGALAQWLLARPSLYGLPASLPFLGLGETHYREPVPVCGITEAAAAIALASERASRDEAGVRRIAAQAYTESLAGAQNVTLVRAPADAGSGYLRFPVLIRGSARVAALGSRARRLGVAASYPSILPSLPATRRLAAVQSEAAYPGAEALVQGLFTLPTHSRLTRPEREAIIRLLLA